MICRWCHEPKDPELDICFPCIFPEVREEDRPDKRGELIESIRTRLMEERPMTDDDRRIGFRIGVRLNG